jgi:bifunctional UDP-N-acetylglucosamine pyrophosphorylase/glucosamine-1-phosphate N-acetyltransferase
MKNVSAVVMAAGLGKRMKSKKAKVLHPVADRPMVWYMATVAQQVSDSKVVMILGHQAEKVEAYLKEAIQDGTPLQVARQVQQLGTGDAVKQAKAELFPNGQAIARNCVILNGDTPLLTRETVEQLLAHHETQQATVTLLTTELPDPKGYGRIVRGQDQTVLKIVEDSDASPEEKAIREINVGTYVVDGQFLFTGLDQLQPQNAQGEYYLTDIIAMAVDQGLCVSAMKTDDPRECFGINSREHLAVAEQVMRERIRTKWLVEGVMMIDPATTWIGADVEIGRDAVLYPNVHLEGQTTIGEDVVIRAGSRIKDCRIGEGAQIEDHCVLEESVIESGALIGPFARLRPGTMVRQGAKIGNFVEVKKAEVKEGAKVNHLSYIGDAEIGKKANIGAGAITCNYDGFTKSKTIIGDGVFVGSDSQFVAPVTIGAGAVIGAGSTITKDVPEDALAVSRPEQVNLEGVAAKRRAARSGQNGKQPNKSSTPTAQPNGSNITQSATPSPNVT